MSRNIALVLGAFHKTEVEEMAREAKLAAAEMKLNVIEEVWVPGSYEKPLALKKLLARDDIEGAVVLGIIEKGETKHGLVMAQTVMKAIIDLELFFMKPVGIGIVGPEVLPNQIRSRLKSHARRAIEAVDALLEK